VICPPHLELVSIRQKQASLTESNLPGTWHFSAREAALPVASAKVGSPGDLGNTQPRRHGPAPVVSFSGCRQSLVEKAGKPALVITLATTASNIIASRNCSNFVLTLHSNSAEATKVCSHCHRGR